MKEYQAGAVWWCSIDFGDGDGPRRKYFVLLGDADGGAQVLAAIATSKGDSRYGEHGRTPSPCCAAPCFRIDANLEACFDRDTWVQFDNAYPISRASLEQFSREGRTGFLQPLSDERLRSLLNCARKSRDIPTRNLTQIEAALKARNPIKKAPAKAPAPSTAAPLFVDPDILAVRLKVDGFCLGCRGDLAGLLGLEATALAAILRGAQPASPTLKKDVAQCMELLAPQVAACDKCK